MTAIHPLMWQALQNCVTISGHGQSKLVIWNNTKKILRYNLNQNRVSQFIGQLLSLTTILAPDISLLIYQLFGTISIPPSFLVIHIILLSFSTFGYLIGIVSQNCMKDYVIGFNSSISLEKVLREKCEFRKKLASTKAGTLLGILLNLGVTLYASGAYFITIFGIFSEFDPLFLVQKYILHSVHFPLYLRAIVLLPAIHICNTLCLMFCLLTVTAHLSISSISCLDKLAPCLGWGKGAGENYLRLYTRLSLNFTLCAGISNCCCLLFMGVGLFCGVGVNFVTMKMYGITPISIYLLFPVCAVFMGMIADIMTTMIVKISESSCTLVWKMERYLSPCGDRAFVRRKLRVVRNVKVNAGIGPYVFFGVNAGTKLAYYYTVVNFTITALLSIQIETNGVQNLY
ncbi:putative SMEK 3 [Folsomia candida]|uniref:Putative SMEK 3 n=1 Tax=Folsomia candida TaxID=158441 RepID=A0A226DKV7_FOLCA|nr:putative SMEK 3 [Folsomia candida]